MKKFSLIFLLFVFCGFAWAEDTPTPTPTPYFYLSKSSDKTVYNPGDTITYSLNWSVTNTAEDLQIFDTIPDEVEYVGSDNLGYIHTVDWVAATLNAEFPLTNGNTVLTFNNGTGEKLWILGGGAWSYRSVWYSSDGVVWGATTTAAAFPGRAAHFSTVFDNKMWVMGGYTTSGQNPYYNDVWYSTDGADWIAATRNAEWSGRREAGVVAFDAGDGEKLWIMGGRNSGSGTLYNDCWYSTNGVEWTAATRNAEFTAQEYYRAVTFSGKIWLVGGGSKDVWYSSNGIEWTAATRNAEFGVRSAPVFTVWNNRMWIISGGNFADHTTYSSSDGVVWKKSNIDGLWLGRSVPTGATFNNKLWLTCGWTQDAPNRMNDVWYSTPKSISWDVGNTSNAYGRVYRWWGKLKEGIIGLVTNVANIFVKDMPVKVSTDDIYVNSPTVTETVTPTITQTVTETSTATKTVTATRTVTITVTPTNTSTTTPTPTITMTATQVPNSSINKPWGGIKKWIFNWRRGGRQ